MRIGFYAPGGASELLSHFAAAASAAGHQVVPRCSRAVTLYDFEPFDAVVAEHNAEVVQALYAQRGEDGDPRGRVARQVFVVLPDESAEDLLGRVLGRPVASSERVTEARDSGQARARRRQE